MAGHRADRAIRSSDRVCIVGATGSGKTHLATRYLTRFPNVIAADPKGTAGMSALRIPKDRLYRDLDKLTREYKGGRAAFRPGVRFFTVRERDRLAAWDRLALFVFSIGHVVYYVDELRAITGDGKAPPTWLSAVLQMGRERGVGCWLATQRPKRVPLNAISEADTYLVFHLGHPSDRALMAELTETPEVRNVIPHKHGFYLYQPGMREARYYSGLKSDERG